MIFSHKNKKSQQSSWEPKIVSRPVRALAKAVRKTTKRVRPLDRKDIVLSRNHEQLAQQIKAHVSRHPKVEQVSVSTQGKMGASWRITVDIVTRADDNYNRMSEEQMMRVVSDVLDHAWNIGGTSFGAYSVVVSNGRESVDAHSAGFSTAHVLPNELSKRFGPSHADK